MHTLFHLMVLIQLVSCIIVCPRGINHFYRPYWIFFAISKYESKWKFPLRIIKMKFLLTEQYCAAGAKNQCPLVKTDTFYKINLKAFQSHFVLFRTRCCNIEVLI